MCSYNIGVWWVCPAINSKVILNFVNKEISRGDADNGIQSDQAIRRSSAWDAPAASAAADATLITSCWYEKWALAMDSWLGINAMLAQLSTAHFAEEH